MPITNHLTLMYLHLMNIIVAIISSLCDAVDISGENCLKLVCYYFILFSVKKPTKTHYKVYSLNPIYLTTGLLITLVLLESEQPLKRYIVGE